MLIGHCYTAVVNYTSFTLSETGRNAIGCPGLQRLEPSLWTPEHLKDKLFTKYTSIEHDEKPSTIVTMTLQSNSEEFDTKRNLYGAMPNPFCAFITILDIPSRMCMELKEWTTGRSLVPSVLWPQEEELFT